MKSVDTLGGFLELIEDSGPGRIGLRMLGGYTSATPDEVRESAAAMVAFANKVAEQQQLVAELSMLIPGERPYDVARKIAQHFELTRRVPAEAGGEGR